MFRFIAIIVATLALAYAAWANSATTLFSKFAPERGLQMDANSAVALINTTERASAQKDPAAFRRIARPNAIRALRSEPLASRALRQLGTYYATAGNRARGRELIQLSAKLSRRDPTGQLWLADDKLRRRDAKGALEAIDVVIRTQPETRESAFRVLGGALADREFRAVFVPYVKQRPAWLRPFVEYNVGAITQPQILSQTLTQMQPLPRGTLTDTYAGALLTALVNRAPISEARSFYLTLPGANQKALSTLSFAKAADTFRYPPVGWEMLNDGNIQGFGDVDGKAATIEAIATPGRSGTAARKLLFLRSGVYLWSAKADLGELSEGGAARIQMSCNKGPGDWAALSAKNLVNGANSVAFTVPAGCEAQLLAIGLSSADGQNDVNIAISQMQLRGFFD